MSANPTIVPCLVYQDAPRAIDFLCDAFGFTRQLVVPGETPGEIVHAQLARDGGMVMLGSARPDNRERFGIVPSATVGNLVTATVYLVVADPDAHHATAAAHGATIISAPQDNDYGGRGYSARDLEGNVWSFGSYDPWEQE